MPTKAKTPAEMRLARIQELDWRAQQQARHDAERAERRRKDAEFLQAVNQRKALEAQARERGEELPRIAVPTLDGYFTASAQAEKAERERIETERLNAIPERERFINALPRDLKDVIHTYKRVNGQDFPLEMLQYYR